MKLRNPFRSQKANDSRKEGAQSFSDFFLHASKEEKDRVIREAARKANEEQMRVFKKARLKTEAN